jgi:predicted exporter
VKIGRGASGAVWGAIACWLWLALSVAFLAWKFSGDLPVDTDIQSMLPASGSNQVERAAMVRAGEAAAGRVAFLVKAPDAALAGEAAGDLESRLRAGGLFASDFDDAPATGAWVFANRNQLLCQTRPDQFDAAAAQRVARRAMADVFSVTGAVTGGLLKQDPFLLTMRLAECLPPTGAAKTQPNERLVSGRIAQSAYRLDAQEHIVASYNTWKADWALRGVTAARAGAVFHADAAAESAKGEIGLIGTIGSIGVALLFFAAFRTLRSVAQGMILVGIGLTGGLAATLLVFPSIHVLVFVFAAMLVGIVSDYAVHTLATGPATDWASTRERLRLVGRPITVSMATTVLGFASLALFGSTLFQQVALLAGVGVAIAWAFVLFVLTPLDRRPKNAEKLRAWWLQLERWREAVKIPGWLTWTATAGLGLLALVGVMKFAVLDDVRKFQPRPADLMADEATLQAAGYGGSGVTFLLSMGDTPDKARQLEEEALAEAPEGVRILATTRFDPSAERRAANQTVLMEKLYSPLLDEQLATLGVEPNPGMFEPLRTPPEPPQWLKDLSGEAAGKSFLIAPILNAGDWKGPAITGVRLIDPAERYSAAFAGYRQYALMALAVAFVFAAISTLLIYRKWASVSILAPPLLAVIISLLAPPALGLPLTFFSFAGALVLVGVGIDYAAFQWEGGLQTEDRWTGVAVLVDAATTLLSMGLLMLSSTYPVKSFGVTVTIGIAAALCLSHIPRLVAQWVAAKGSSPA